MPHSNVIIVHGAYGYPEENWFDWLRVELEHIYIPCLVPCLPTPQGQTLENWHKSFDIQCAHFIHSNTVLIGHSLGAAFVLRWLEKSNNKIDLAIFVGAFLEKVGIDYFDSINESFFSEPFYWDKIKSNANHFVCYHGDNDTYVSRSDFDFICRKLCARKVIIANAGHMNSSSGYSQFSQLLLYLKESLKVTISC